MMAAAAVVPLLAYGAVSIISVGEGAEQAVIQGNQNVSMRAAEEIRHRPLRQRFMEGIALAVMRLALAIQGKNYL